jgi:parallel beta-helix repeat protein
MKRIVTFASNVHASALLCCSAAVLLTACGGNTGGSTTDTSTATLSHGVQSANASEATVAAAGQTAALTEESAGTGAFEHASATANAPQTTRLLATMSSATTGDTTTQITDLYRTLLNREPDSAGLQFWIQQMNAGMSIDGVKNEFLNSAEYKNLQAAAPAPAPAPAADPSAYHLYVATTGSDSNSGTKAAPFKTITKAAAAAKASTTVHVAAGTYAGNVSTKTSGSASGKIRFVSDTKWGAKIVGTGSEAMWTNNGNYVEINGFDITGPGRLGILNYASNTLVANNHIHNLTLSGGCTGDGGAGVVNATYGSTNGDMIGNVVHDIGKPGGCNGVQGLYSSNTGGTIANNVVYRVSSFGIHLWHAASGTTIANNTVFANGSTGMGGGIVIGVGDSPGGVLLNNVKVINNIVYNNPRGGIQQYCYSGSSCIGTGNVVSNNLVYGSSTNVGMLKGSATGTISADPKFVSYNPTATGDYRLQSGSPAVNKGIASGAPATDILGVARPKGGAFDIGAYENF